MRNVSKILSIALVAIFFMVSCKTSGGGQTQTALSSAKLDEAKVKKVVEDFLLKTVGSNPNAQFKILGIKEAIPGIASVRVEVRQKGITQRMNLFASNDGKFVAMCYGFQPTKDGKYVFRCPFVETSIDVSKVSAEEETIISEKMINTKGAPSMGPDNAPVRIVEFADFQCPYCGMMYKELKPMLEKYKGKIKLTFMQFPLPFHPWAMQAAVASQCAFKQKPEAFWDFYDFYYRNQKDLNPANIEEKSIEEARKIGLNVKEFKKCLKDPSTKDEINKFIQEGKKLQVNATPTFFINGKIVPGAVPPSQLEKYIQEAMKK